MVAAGAAGATAGGRLVQKHEPPPGFQRKTTADSAAATTEVGIAAAPPLPSPSPSPDASFLAAEFNTWNPPDTDGAAGPDHLVVALNGTLRIQTKAGVTVSTTSLDDFFGAVRAGNGTYDPQVKYDALAGHFVLTCGAGGDSPTAAFLVGVSQTSDPTGSWRLYNFEADPNHVVWPDFPKFGMNKNWIVVTGTMYGGVGLTSTLLVCDKAALLSGVGQCTRITQGPWRTMPMLSFDPSLDTMYLARHGDFPGGIGNNIKIDTITGPIGAEVLTLDVANAVMPESWAVGPGVGEFMPQLGSTIKMGSDPENIVSFIYRNGSLWGVNTAALPPSAPTHTATQWWQITPSGTVQQFGRVEDPTGAVFYNYPSLAVNKNNDVLVGFSRFTAEQYPAAGYAFRSATDPAGAMRIDAVLKPERPSTTTRAGATTATPPSIRSTTSTCGPSRSTPPGRPYGHRQLGDLVGQDRAPGSDQRRHPFSAG
jgi:hypothetical protein